MINKEGGREGEEGLEVGRVSKEKRRMKRRRGKGTGYVAHLLLMSCESFANCLQVATKSGILSKSWLTCSSTATNCVSVRCVGWWWEVEWGGGGRCVGRQWEVCGVVVGGVEGEENSQYHNPSQGKVLWS